MYFEAINWIRISWILGPSHCLFTPPFLLPPFLSFLGAFHYFLKVGTKLWVFKTCFIPKLNSSQCSTHGFAYFSHKSRTGNHATWKDIPSYQGHQIRPLSRYTPGEKDSKAPFYNETASGEEQNWAGGREWTCCAIKLLSHKIWKQLSPEGSHSS